MLTLPCRFCGDPLHQIAHLPSDEFRWVDASDSPVGLDADLRHLPDGDGYAALNALADLGRDERGRLKAMPLAAAQQYSALLVRLDMKGTHHTHMPESGAEPPWPGPRAADHCGWPAWVRPSGWWCRVCGLGLEAPTAPSE